MRRGGQLKVGTLACSTIPAHSPQMCLHQGALCVAPPPDTDQKLLPLKSRSVSQATWQRRDTDWSLVLNGWLLNPNAPSPPESTQLT